MPSNKVRRGWSWPEIKGVVEEIYRKHSHPDSWNIKVIYEGQLKQQMLRHLRKLPSSKIKSKKKLK